VRCFINSYKLHEPILVGGYRLVGLDVVMVSWLIIAAVCFIGEIMIPQFFLFWFGVGSIGALASHFLGLSYSYQWVVFAVISVVGLISTRRFARMILKKEPRKAGVERLIDEVMLVTKEIDNSKSIGQVKGIGRYLEGCF
jgi:membrane protein implicated in regulation of membrane protease activity